VHDGLLFGYFETPDSPPAAYARMAAKQVHAGWQEFMATLFRVAR
jgi:L-rhamnose mutarotase